MERLFQKILAKLKFIYVYVKSFVVGFICRRRFRSIEKFVLFTGYARSGHSIIAALLDAHPDIVMGMEWGVLSHLRFGYGRLQIFSSITRNTKLFRKRRGNVWTGYSYRVDGLWQGEYRVIKVIGDKLGGQTSLMINQSPDLIEKLRRKIGIPLAFIHVIRNPFDTITTLVLRSFEQKKITRAPVDMDLLPFINGYFRRVETISALKENKNIKMIDIYHEDFIKNPRKILKDLLSFLEVEIFEEYIEKCSKIVYKEPHKSRLDVEWPEELVKFVQKYINRYTFLNRYTFHS
jgi:hypothetical protein